MKILFIENRYRTRFWDEVAGELSQDGHEVSFLVQNHWFKPRHGKVTLLPYPGRDNGADISDTDRELIKSDRNINYFHHRETAHYPWYRKSIRDYLDRERPDVVFGESTAFHELITISLCQELSIPYLQPSTCRFPTGRFSFYRYDTLEPFFGSDEVLPDRDALNLIDSIVHRSIKPDYMHKRMVTFATRWKRWADLVHLSAGYLGGERYNTPAPWIKLRIERKKKELIGRWDALAEERSGHLSESRFRILYPMQMQPEANLDVWGRPYRDQLETIRQLVARTPPDVQILVKPNPKSKYELTESLLTYLASEERVIPVAHSVQMGKVLPLAGMVVTVTGTIAIECILADIPVVTMIKTLNNSSENCLWAASFDQIPPCLEMARNGVFPKTENRAKIDFLNLLNRTSFRGLPYEAFLTEENIKDCMIAFRKVLRHMEVNGFAEGCTSGR